MICALLCGLSLASSATEWTNGVLDFNKEIYLLSREIDLKVIHHGGVNMQNYKDPEYIVNKFMQYSLEYNEKYGIKDEPLTDCVSNVVNIIYVKDSFLNDPDRMRIWFGPTYLEKYKGKKFVGLYDYRYYENNIYITDSRYKEGSAGLSFEDRLAHEISHFWYAKSCLEIRNPLNESRALEFERIVE